MRILNGIVGIALLGISGVAVADEPVRLDAASLDAVTAGLWNGFALAFTTPALSQGASTTIFQGSQVQTQEQVELTPPTFTGTFQSSAVSQSSTRTSGVGTTLATGGGGVYTGVFVAN